MPLQKDDDVVRGINRVSLEMLGGSKSGPTNTTGKVDKDQVADYAKSKGMTLKEAKCWLASVLSY